MVLSDLETLQDHELTYPSRVNSDGHHISFELSDDTPNKEDRLYFRVEAFGEIFILNVTTNSQFVANDLVVEYVWENGSTLEYPKETRCFHSGHIVRAGGWAAVSSCRGGLVSVDHMSCFSQVSSHSSLCMLYRD